MTDAYLIGQNIAAAAKEKNITKVLLVTDSGVKKLTKSLVDDLKENEITPVVFDNVMPNPTISVIEEVSAEFASSADVIIYTFQSDGKSINIDPE